MREAKPFVHSVAKGPGLIGRAMVMVAADRLHGAGHKGAPPTPGEGKLHFNGMAPEDADPSPVPSADRTT
ncbi:UNVERIFIED_ORG: hypothetical protein ABIB52_004676 [Arthrobacter sp. UYCu721]